jgi:Protein of unknown function (DUF2844)
MLMKRTRSVSISLLAAALLVGACVSAPARAALGADASSVEADRVHLKGALRVTPGVSYTVHEIQLPAGIRVREYVSPAGQVFAVTWRGTGIPDLHQLLGTYSSQLAAASKQPHYNHRQLSVQTPDVVFGSSSYLRTYSGRAWLPALLPPNFSLGDLN